jgi:hypothetical protein
MCPLAADKTTWQGTALGSWKNIEHAPDSGKNKRARVHKRQIPKRKPQTAKRKTQNANALLRTLAKPRNFTCSPLTLQLLRLRLYLVILRRTVLGNLGLVGRDQSTESMDRPTTRSRLCCHRRNRFLALLYSVCCKNGHRYDVRLQWVAPFHLSLRQNT